ncbi:MAG: HAD family hydrolase [Prevotella sp.]|nr:HAD family hydrolase [Prevotella sp.]
MPNKVVVFDLEDTLYQEIDFLKSGYHAVADYLTKDLGISDLYEEMIEAYQAGEIDVFQKVLDTHHLTINKSALLDVYRYHIPQIHLDTMVRSVLGQLQGNCHLALITDGRPRTKRNIINALGLSDYFDGSDVFISEEVGHLKTDPYSFEKIMESYPGCQYVYVGDNPAKDFLVPNRLGWMTVCLLDHGQNIHSQDLRLAADYLPQRKIKVISELIGIINDTNRLDY